MARLVTRRRARAPSPVSRSTTDSEDRALMDIALSLQNALTGLQAAQANLAIISSTITNAQTPGYSRETVPLSTQIVGNAGAGVLVGVTQRQVDNNLATAARQQDTAASAATTTNSYFQQIQSLFGQVNSGDSPGNVLTKFPRPLPTLPP